MNKKDDKRVICPVCNKKLTTPLGLANHMKIKHINDLPCPWCGMRCKNYDGLACHVSARHGKMRKHDIVKKYLEVQK